MKLVAVGDLFIPAPDGSYDVHLAPDKSYDVHLAPDKSYDAHLAPDKSCPVPENKKGGRARGKKDCTTMLCLCSTIS